MVQTNKRSWLQRGYAVKRRTPILELVHEFGGRMADEEVDMAGWTAVFCPFHDDRHASAAIHYSAGRFVCKACVFKGTQIDMVMRVGHAKDFKGAVEWLEERLERRG